MYILDSDILSLFHAGNENVGQRMDAVDPAELATSIVTKVEILRARYAFLLNASDGEQLLRAQHWLHQSEELLEDIEVIPFDEAAATQFDALRNKKQLKKVGRADLLISSIALAQRATLVTRNLKDFQQVPNLKLENWAD